MQPRIRQISSVAGIAVALFIVLGGTALAQSDPYVGTWKQNLAKSKYDPASLTVKTGTIVKREVAGSGYKVTTDGTSPQGSATHTEYTAATVDGKDYPLKGSADFDSISLRRIDANTIIDIRKKGGTIVRFSRNIVSKDGKMYTSDQVGYNAQGVAFYTVLVFDKQ